MMSLFSSFVHVLFELMCHIRFPRVFLLPPLSTKMKRSVSLFRHRHSRVKRSSKDEALVVTMAGRLDLAGIIPPLTLIATTAATTTTAAMAATATTTTIVIATTAGMGPHTP
jgi:hypothetical protein